MSKSLTKVEQIKARSRHLRGTLEESLDLNHTGALHDDDTQLSKLHGIYQQDDRDIRNERAEQKLEPLYSFMIRGRIPGGVITSAQWLAIDDIARAMTHNASLRLTTRQTFQFHGIFKRNLKKVVQALVAAKMDSIAACGDVNRNVIAVTNLSQQGIYQQIHQLAVQLSEHFLPQSHAYHEIWLDADKTDPAKETEPIYSSVYLPRKFKIAIAVPPNNEVDVHAHDLGLIAIIKDHRIIGYNVTAGGGMGTTHGDKQTHPRLADTLGFITPDQVIPIAEAILTTQRDHGDRTNRKQARLKYTIEKMGVGAFKEEVEQRAGISFDPAVPVTFNTHHDTLGWLERDDGLWNLTLFIDSGRLIDTPEKQLLTGVREIARIHTGDFRMTANQNLIVAGVNPAEKSAIEQLAQQHGFVTDQLSQLRVTAMACVALPTCSLAMAEAERYLSALTDKVQALLIKHQLENQPITLRISGCPNGCSRPYLGEITLVGKAVGRYNLMLGGNATGERLNKLYRENLNEAEILQELDNVFGLYVQQRQKDEALGDFFVRTEK